MHIKVARVIARLNTGGPAIHAISLARELPEAGLTSRLFAGVVSQDEEDMMPLAVQQGVQMQVIPALSREISLTKDVRAFFQLLAELKRFRPEILHTHTAKAGALGRLAALFVGIPVRIHTFHGHVFHGYFGYLKTQVFLWIERTLACFTDCVIVLCHSQKREIVDTYRIAPAKKVHIIPLGFDFSSYACEEGFGEKKRREWQLTPQHYVCGFIGRLVPIKNPVLFVRGLQLLMEQRHAKPSNDSSADLPLAAVIVGGGMLEHSLATCIEEHACRAQFTLLGWQHSMATIYSALDVVVLTSLNEGTPVALIEAMAAGKPFVATNVGGVKDLMVGKGYAVKGHNAQLFMVYDNGILVESEDVEGLSSAVQYLSNHQELGRQMGQCGRGFALESFGLDRLVNDIYDLYVHELSNKGILMSVGGK